MICCYCCSVKLCLTLCDPHGLPHARLPYPSSSPGVCPSSCPLSQWCHPTISSSVALIIAIIIANDFCCCSVTKSCPTLGDAIMCTTPSFPVLHYLLEFAQTHVYWVSDAIQTPHPLSPPPPLALNLSQYQGLFHWVSSLYQVVIILLMIIPLKSMCVCVYIYIYIYIYIYSELKELKWSMVSKAGSMCIV